MNTKTAEEIIKSKTFKSYGLLVVHVDDVEECMEEYASPLKKRIEELDASYKSLSTLSKMIQSHGARKGQIINYTVSRLQDIADDENLDTGIRNYCSVTIKQVSNDIKNL